MIIKTSIAASALLAISLAMSVVNIAQTHQSRLQVEFGAETEIRQPLPVTKLLLDQIFENNRAELAGVSKHEFIKRLTASRIDLDGDKQTDLLVQGDQGANITGFWVFRSSGGRLRLVMHSRALGLSVLPKRDFAAKDIETFAASAVTGWGALYRFSRGSYKPVKCWAQELGNDRSKKNYFPCTSDTSKPYR